MFEGPNGSGKSVLKAYLPAELLGVYVEADYGMPPPKRLAHIVQ